MQRTQSFRSLMLCFGCIWSLSMNAADAATKVALQEDLSEISGLVLQFAAQKPSEQQLWSQSYEKLKQFVSSGTSVDAFQLAVTQSLRPFGFGPHALVQSSDDLYWQAKNQDSSVLSLGGRFRRIGRYWYAETLTPGSALAKAGLMRGDQLLTSNDQPFRPYQLAGLKHDIHRPATVVIQRDPTEPKRQLKIVPLNQSWHEKISTEISQSATIFEESGKKVAYLSLPSLDATYLAPTKAALIRLDQANPDFWLLDLRSGLSGRAAGFLSLFGLTSQQPAVASLNSKPIYILTNQGTIEGQEWLAWFLRKEKGAQLVGEPTAGHPFESRYMFLKSDRFALKLPIPDPPNNSGLVQGKPLQPDHIMKDTLVYSRGIDELRARTLVLMTGSKS